MSQHHGFVIKSDTTHEKFWLVLPFTEGFD